MVGGDDDDLQYLIEPDALMANEEMEEMEEQTEQEKDEQEIIIADDGQQQLEFSTAMSALPFTMDLPDSYEKFE